MCSFYRIESEEGDRNNLFSVLHQIKTAGPISDNVLSLILEHMNICFVFSR